MCSASEAEDHYLHLLVRFVQPVRETRRSGFVDYSSNLEACDFSGVLGCLSLVIVEVSRDGDYCFLCRASKKRLGVLSYLLKYERGKLLWSVVFPGDMDLVVGAHLPLDLDNCPIRIRCCLPLCRLTDYQLTLFGELDYRWEHLPGCGLSLSARDNDGAASLHYRGSGIRRSKVYSYDLLCLRLTHGPQSPLEMTSQI